MKDFYQWLLMENEQGFLQAISSDPKNMTNWKVYADYLEENDNPLHELIRLLLRKSTNNFTGVEHILNEAPVELKRLLARSFPLCFYAFNFGVSLQTASQVRILVKSKDNPDDILRQIDTLIHGYGVEAVHGGIHVDQYFRDIVGLYVNTGDTYKLTVLYDTPRKKFFVTDLGTWVEGNQRRYRIN